MEKPLPEHLKALGPDVDDALVDKHLARLGDRYFECFSLEEIAAHLRGLATLTAEHPVEILLRAEEGGWVECTFLAFDYPGEFSMLTGALAAMGFNIQSGDVFTQSRDPNPPTRRTRRALLARRSLGRAASVSPIDRRCVIDRFSGLRPEDEAFETWAAELTALVREVAGLLETEEQDKARNRINEMVTRRLEDLEIASLPVLYPVELEVDNDAGPFTRLKVVSEDTPAFLYSLSNALALKGISIERVSIRTKGNRIEDEIDFVDARGAKIEAPETLNQIKLSVLLTKQFTYFLSEAPDRYAALCRFNSLLGDVLKAPERGRWLEMFSYTHNLEDLARVLGASDFMWEDFIRLQHEVLLPIFEPHAQGRRFFDPSTLDRRLDRALGDAEDFEEQRRRLNEFKDRELFLIDLDHILSRRRAQRGDPDQDRLQPRILAENLTRLAERVVGRAFQLVFHHEALRFGRPRTVGRLPARHAILGLGKMGGVALGYASDIELIFVYSDSGQTDGERPIENAEFYEKVVQGVVDFIQAKREGIFHLDLRLRPHGSAGPLACSLENFCRYFGPGGEAHSYERLALVRLRAIGGDVGLGAQIERLRDEFVYAARSVDVAQVRNLRQKQFREKTGPRPNAKFSPGALVDLEYDVQLLQVMYGRDLPALRTPRIHEALEALRRAGFLSGGESERLAEAYYFLRALINGLRMLRGNALDLFLPPPDSNEFLHLARRMGYRRRDDLSPARQLQMDFDAHTAAVRAFVERHFGRDSLPGPAAGNVADLVLSDETPADLEREILENAGFRDPRRASLNLRRLAGREERRNRFARLSVLAFDVLGRKPDPDMALNNWERFVEGIDAPATHFERLLAQPRRLDILLGIFAGSQFLADTLARNSEFMDWVTTPEILNRELTVDIARRELTHDFGPIDTRERWMAALRLCRRREILRIGTRDICLNAPLPNVAEDLSALAEGLLAAALDRHWEESDNEGERAERFCILAFGKLGGQELNYSSDIDLLAVHDGPAHPAFAAALDRVREDLATHTTEGYAYRIDLRLRPWGGAGQLVPSRDAIETYYREKAALWEIQSLIKLRHVAGAEALGRRLVEGLSGVFARERTRDEVGRSIEKLRRQAIRRASRRSPEALDVKDGLGGIRDVEFLVQGLQLIHASRHPAVLAGATLDGIERLMEAGLLEGESAGRLREDYIFLRRVEHYLQLYEDRQTHTTPTDEEGLAALARRVMGEPCEAAAFRDILSERMRRVRSAHEALLLSSA